MPKENLILVHSYPTNSVVLQGLIEYLEEQFTVYFIDLPGFIKGSAPLDRISLAGYAAYVDEYIKKLEIDSYIAAGISFGFLVVNNAKLDSRCKGIIAVGPYTGAGSLHLGAWLTFKHVTRLELANRTHLAGAIWNSKWFRNILPKTIFKGHPVSTTNAMLDNIDVRTFVETGIMILKHKEPCVFHHDLPYALLINNGDDTVGAEYLVRQFTNGVEKLIIVDTEIEHFPKRELTKEYFAENMPIGDIIRIVDFFRNPTIQSRDAHQMPAYAFT